ncbi:alpha/beta hydrolase [Spirosoma utsteinense]|uniref:Esterase n=1 Tax=Spirosoma utsteinense TaxID=2585773 RepID=A0ABR6WCQ1_9BACT|nr:phospholipase [Spirosoma utsteinense]MBC3786924.1 putative esterase [Spirosoma utsteinense]MBC3794304.1 putative esterase [Spirosoma utsteinense]
MTEHHLSVQRTARYYTLGTLTDQTTHIWFCLHGFGQLASFFSKKFTGLDNGKTLVVVPEGLSRLYLNGKYERVGASWITREDKQHEIHDFVAYLNTLYEIILDGRDPNLFHITLLGFSQGAATACRWLDGNGMNSIHVDRLILWAGFFSNGIGDLIDPEKLKDVETHYVYGAQDEFLALIKDIDAYKARLLFDVPNLKTTVFEGGHRVEPSVLANLIAT